jgi:hypothetical protein
MPIDRAWGQRRSQGPLIAHFEVESRMRLISPSGERRAIVAAKTRDVPCVLLQ